MASRLAVRHRRSVARLQRAAGRAAQQQWEALGGDVSDAAMDEFAGQMVPVVAGAGAQAAGLSDAYLTAHLRGQGLDARPQGVRVPYPRGVDPAEVYARPIVTARAARSQGHAWPDALRQGAHRAVQTAITDVQLFERSATSEWMRSEPRVVGYRRVLGDGGASGENCGLCIVASTQRYHTGELMPIHSSCSCGVEPIVGERDPGQVIDRERLEFVNEEADDRTRQALSRFRAEAGELPTVKVVAHGELGPVMYDANWSVTPFAA